MNSNNTGDESKVSEIKNLVNSLPEGRLRESLQMTLDSFTSSVETGRTSERDTASLASSDYEKGSILDLVKSHRTLDSVPNDATYLTYFTHLFHRLLNNLDCRIVQEPKELNDSQLGNQGTGEHLSVLFEGKTAGSRRFFVTTLAMDSSIVLLFHPASASNAVPLYSLSFPLSHFVASSDAQTPLSRHSPQVLTSLGKESASEPILSSLRDILTKIQSFDNSQGESHSSNDGVGGGGGGGSSSRVTASHGRSTESMVQPPQQDRSSSSLMGIPQPLTGQPGDFDRDLRPDFRASVPGALLGAGGDNGVNMDRHRLAHPGSQIGPDHPLFGNMGSGGIRGPDIGPQPPGVPPGARFDPVFPAGVQPPDGMHPTGGPRGPPRGPRMGPQPDHLRPPPNNPFGPHFGW